MNCFAIKRNSRPPRRSPMAWLPGFSLCLQLIQTQTFFAAESPGTFSRDIQPVIEQYCYKCHGAAKPKAGINLEQFKDDTSVWRDPRLWETVVSQLRERA